jgi:sarcosine oxidase subunit delta
VNRLYCPYCGPREQREFRFHKTLPERADAEPYARVYERLGNMTHSREHWQHLDGCRAWLFVRRDPSSGAVLEVRVLGGDAA